MTDNDKKVEQWNKAIAPRINSFGSWFKDPCWVDGWEPYLRGQLKQLMTALIIGGESSDMDKLRGKIIALEEMLAFPETIENSITQAETIQKKQRNVGDAGY
jgi:hypothetical protein